MSLQEERQPALNIASIVNIAIAICVFIYLLQRFVLTPDQNFDLLVRAAFIPIRYSGQFPIDVYAFTSPVTYSFFHGGFAHLAVNVVWLAAVGSPLANRIGAVRFALFWAVTAILSAAAHYLVYPGGQAPLIGASGAISAMMAASVRYGFAVDRSKRLSPYSRPLLTLGEALRTPLVLVYSGIWMLGNLAVGLLWAPDPSSSIAWEAHIGGYLAGLLLIGFFDTPPPRPKFDPSTFQTTLEKQIGERHDG